MTKKIQQKLDSFLFFIAIRIPERMIPGVLQQKIEAYAARRVTELQQDLIQQKWHVIKLQQELQKIKAAQQD